MWATWSRFTTVTVCPGWTVCAAGRNMKLVMTISACRDGAAADVVAGADAGPEAQAVPTSSTITMAAAATRRRRAGR